MLGPTHYAGGLGFSGCLPDYYVCGKKKEVIDSLCECAGNPKGMRTALQQRGYFEFDNPTEAGADYAELMENRNIESCDRIEDHFPDPLID